MDTVSPFVGDSDATVTRARLARVLGVFLLVGCSSLLGLEDGGLQGSSCSSASDCDPKHGAVCFEGQCRTACVLGCKADEQCTAGACVEVILPQGGGGAGTGGSGTAGGAGGAGGAGAGGAGPEGNLLRVLRVTGPNAGNGGRGGSENPTTPVDPAADGAPDSASGIYVISQGDGQAKRCLEVSETQAKTTVCDSFDDERKFYLDPGSPGHVRVRSAQHSGCIAGGAASPIVTVCSEDVEFELVSRYDGRVQLRDPSTDKCLASAGKLEFETCTSDTVWEVTPVNLSIARDAAFSATTTSMFGYYSVDYIHDGDYDTGLSDHSWTHDWNYPTIIFPQHVEVEFSEQHQFCRIDLLTTLSYEIKEYDIQYWDGGAWSSLSWL